MNNYTDMSGLDLFSTPFSTPARPSPKRQPARQAPPAGARLPESSRPTRQVADTKQRPSAAPQPNPAPAATAPVPDEKPAPTAHAPAQADTTKQASADLPKMPAPVSTQPATPQKELVLDMSSGSGAAPVQDDAEKRKAHEESEAKRKAAWEAKQAAKKQAEEAAIHKLQAMNDKDVIVASTARISTEVERLTRRNMKECVAEHIQNLCRKDAEFARRTMHPHKSMVKCFRYINRVARDYVKQEMEDNDIKPDGGMYGCDIPDWIVYQSAEGYFNSTDAPEDQEKEEKFVPKPYAPTKASKAKPKKVATTAKKETGGKQKSNEGYEQMSFL